MQKILYTKQDGSILRSIEVHEEEAQLIWDALSAANYFMFSKRP